MTLAWVTRVKLALVDDTLDDQQLDGIRQRWLSFLDELPDDEASGAEREVHRFATYAVPLLRPDEDES